jgi:peptidylprolyl isomerase
MHTLIHIYIYIYIIICYWDFVASLRCIFTSYFIVIHMIVCACMHAYLYTYLHIQVIKGWDEGVLTMVGHTSMYIYSIYIHIRLPPYDSLWLVITFIHLCPPRMRTCSYVYTSSQRVGEMARIKCTPDYAYGAGGFPAWGIMPNSTLVFEIEVLSAN